MPINIKPNFEVWISCELIPEGMQIFYSGTHLFWLHVNNTRIGITKEQYDVLIYDAGVQDIDDKEGKD